MRNFKRLSRRSVLRFSFCVLDLVSLATLHRVVVVLLYRPDLARSRDPDAEILDR